MNIPTHIVVDTKDGFVFSRDRYGNLFDEENATRFAEIRNHELPDEHRTYVVCIVAPVNSPELVQALIREVQETHPQLEEGQHGGT